MWRLLTLAWLYLNMLHLISNSCSSRQKKQEDAKRLSGKHRAKKSSASFFFPLLKIHFLM